MQRPCRGRELRVLVVCTHEMFLKSTGSTRRLEFYLEALSPPDRIALLVPSSLRGTGNHFLARYKTYYFRYFEIGERSLWFLSDVNPFFLTALCKAVREEDTDIVQIHMPWGVLSGSLLSGRPVVYVAHSVESDLVGVEVSRFPLLIGKLAYYYCYVVEFLACRSARHITCTGDVDRNRFIQKYRAKPSKLSAVPIGVRIDEEDQSLASAIETRFRHGRDDGKVVAAFLGSYFHVPNKTAIRLITDYIAPRVWELDQKIMFLIAGNGVPKFAIRNVRSVGFVEDIGEFLRLADFAVCPVLEGPGVRTKILDFMKLGVPVVATQAAMQGLECKDGRDAIVTRGVDEDFVKAVVDLANDSEERKRVGANARNFIRERYSFERLRSRLIDLYEQICNGLSEN